ncbi:MAG TPA: alpha/beta hydrolase [Leadbetterella sp.]|nr:alpha/beta hydrolase [Leadbetterella sp.]
MNFCEFSPTFIKWIPPTKDESIETYASRILGQIHSPNPILIGLSFGGIMAVEVAKLIETEKVIVIASAKTKSEIPFYFRFIGKLRLLNLVPVSFLKKYNFITSWFFGAKKDSERTLLKQILKDTDPVFLKWSLEKVIFWENNDELRNIFHIHGTHDRILPIKFVKSDIHIKNGGHFMTLSHSEEISKILIKTLKLAN